MLEPARLSSNTNNGSDGERRVPSLSLGDGALHCGLFHSLTIPELYSCCLLPPQWQGNYAPGLAASVQRIYAFQGLLLT